MAESLSHSQPLNYQPDPPGYNPPNEVSDCDDPLAPCDECPPPRMTYAWYCSGNYGFEPDEDITDGDHSIWIGGIAHWNWSTGGLDD